MVDVLASVTLSSVLLAFVFFLLWRCASAESRHWQRDAGRWFDRWVRASTVRRPRRDPADWWKGGGDA